MKSAENFLALKMETMQMLMSLQDIEKLKRVRALLEEKEPTPQVLLDLIKRGQAEAKAGFTRPIEEFLEEVKDL